MTFNNEIRVQRKTARKTRFLFILNSIQRKIKSHDKKENKKKNVTSYRDRINIKKRYTRKPRTEILKETINILGRQEQKKRQILIKTKL